MIEALSGAWIYAIPMALAIGGNFISRRRRETRSRLVWEQARTDGLVEPASLHPVIDPMFCVGCASCVKACPENEVLGLIGGKAQVINPTHCIGHGACEPACPNEAISLVFGTATRGVDIPRMDSRFETNVPHVFIAGELGGMGLIRNAVEQGRQAIDSIRRIDGIGKGDCLDVVVVGAGPAGFSGSLAALEHGLRTVTLEQETLGGTVAHFPRGKLVMTAPMRLPIAGQMNFTEISKEELLELWQSVAESSGVQINYGERVESITRDGPELLVVTNKDTYRTLSVLLAIGRRGTPRKLDVPGEEQSKVVYRLIDPTQYAGNAVTVVGGGDSALEAAIALAETDGTDVTIAYRRDSFSRVKPANRAKLDQAREQGRVRVLLNTTVREIRSDEIELETDGETTLVLPNDTVIVCAGGVLPTPFLESIGIDMETKFGTR